MSENSQPKRSFARVKIGVSSCLLGQEVRYNGGHKRDRFLVSSLSQFVDYIPVCPGLSRRGLIAFHTVHKFLLMAHSQAAYQRMGRMLADLGDVDLDAVALMYASEMMTALERRATQNATPTHCSTWPDT